MNANEILSHIDHTQLQAVSSWTEIEKLCREALTFHTASVCIPPSFVKQARTAFGSALNICTVIGFPLGYNTMETKVFETKNAVENGADEIDMVINLGDAKSGAFDRITEEIKAVRQAAQGRLLKVIIETCYLNEAEKKALCRCVTEAGADYIKTSTGFGTAGAVLADIGLFRENIGPAVKIKAAGGVKSRQDMEAFLEAGCNRIGSSSGVSLLQKEGLK